MRTGLSLLRLHSFIMLSMRLVASTELKDQVVQSLISQGYSMKEDGFILDHLDRQSKRDVHYQARVERVKKNIKFILGNVNIIAKYLRDGKDINVNKIDPQLVLVKPGTEFEVIFRWWNMVWWSLPYEKAYGRQMRYLVWDRYHNAPIGLIGLQSPILSWSVRDDYLGIKANERDYWVNQSLSAQRLGSLPPYNELLGGKLVASLMTSNKIRTDFESRYKDRVTLLANRVLPSRLLFLTTTGAYGKSSVYNRLKMDGVPISQFIGYTRGSGTFHISDTLFDALMRYLESQDYDTRRSFGHGPSRRLRLVDVALTSLGIKNGNNHGVQRAVYLFPLAKNLQDVIRDGKHPKWYRRSVQEVTRFWKNRWAVPRSINHNRHLDFKGDQFIAETLNELEDMVNYVKVN